MVKFKQLGRSISRIFRKHGGTMLAVASCVGVGAVAATTARASFKAKDALDKAEEEKGEELTAKEKLQVAAPFYILPASATAATIGFTLGSNIVNKKQQAGLMAACAGMSNALNYYSENYGNGKVMKHIDSERYPSVDPKNIISKHSSSEETHLYFEPFTGTFLSLNEFQLSNAEYMINKELTESGLVFLKDYLYWLGLEGSGIAEKLVWDATVMEDRYATTWINIFYIAEETSDGQKFYTINYEIPPMPEDVF